MNETCYQYRHDASRPTPWLEEPGLVRRLAALEAAFSSGHASRRLVRLHPTGGDCREGVRSAGKQRRTGLPVQAALRRRLRGGLRMAFAALWVSPPGIQK